MANCPHCNYKLRFWHIKAECPSCGVNIPNYNWEERLEQDADIAEAALKKFRLKVAAIKSTLFGSAVRIVRFIMTFVPLIIFPLPFIKFALYIPFPREPKSYSLINIAMGIVKEYNIKAIINTLNTTYFKVPAAVILASLILVAVAVLFGVLNFVFMLTSSFSMKNTKSIFCCAVSTLAFLALLIMLLVFKANVLSAYADIIHFGLGPAIYIGLALFITNLTLNIIIHPSLKRQRKEHFSF